jgi:hypothetical protein
MSHTPTISALQLSYDLKEHLHINSFPVDTYKTEL